MAAAQPPDGKSDTFWIPAGDGAEEIRLTRHGRWLSDGREITHASTCQAFARGLARDGQGYFVRLGYEAKRIVVEDTAYFVRAVEGSAASGFTLILGDESREPLAATSLAYRAPDRLTCRVRQGTETARILKPAYDEVLRGLERDARGHFVVIAGTKVALD